MKLRKTNRNFFFAAAFCLAALFAAPIHAALTVEFDGADVRISNTNATLDAAFWNIQQSTTICIPAGYAGLPEGTRVRVSSLDIGYVEDHQWGATHARRINISSDSASWSSSLVTTNGMDAFTGSSSTCDRLVYSFDGCILAVGQEYSLSFLDAAGDQMTQIRYKLAKTTDTIMGGVDYDASYTPVFQLKGEVVDLFTSTYADGSWSMPEEYTPTNAVGYTLSSSGVEFSIGNSSARGCAVGILADVPAKSSGTISALHINGHTIQANYDGNGSFSIEFDENKTPQTSWSKSQMHFTGAHVYTLIYYFNVDSPWTTAGTYPHAAVLYMDGAAVAYADDSRWTDCKMTTSAAIGSDANGGQVTSGMHVYSADVYFNDNITVSDVAHRVFSAFGGKNEEYTLARQAEHFTHQVGNGDTEGLEALWPHRTSTLAQGYWESPMDASSANGAHVDGLVISNGGVKQSLANVQTNAVSISVLAELPDGKAGAIAGFNVANGNSTHKVFAYANGDGTFTIFYDNKAKTSSSKSSSGLDATGFHIWTLAFEAYNGAKLYCDGKKIAEDPGIKWTSTLHKVANCVSVGNSTDGAYPFPGLKVYAVHTDFGPDSGIFNKATAAAKTTFDSFDFFTPATSKFGIGTQLLMLDNYAKYAFHGSVSCNGRDAGALTSAHIISIFGQDAATEGLTLGLAGFDPDSMAFSLSMSPDMPTGDGNTLSIVGCRRLGDRWENLKSSSAAHDGDVISLEGEDFSEYKFFKVSVSKGSGGVYTIDETASTIDDDTETSSHFVSSAVTGDAKLLSLTLSGGSDGDYSASAYRSLSFKVDGIAEGATCHLTVAGNQRSATVDSEGNVVFTDIPLFGIPTQSDSTTLTLAVQTAKADGNGTAIDSTVMDIRAGVLSYSWGDGSGGTIEGGVTNTMTMLANKPTTDGLGGSSGGGYRIPGIAKSTNGVIVAVYDCRYNGTGDLPNKIDIAENCSTDNARTWTMPRIAIDVPNGGSANKAYDIGDPCILYNPADDKFWLMGITGNGLHTTATDADVVLYTRGTRRDDKWKAWEGGPADDKRSVQQMILDSLNSADPDNTTSAVSALKGILQGPGHGFVQRNNVTNSEGAVIMPKGALVFPMQYFPTNTTTLSHNFAVYSTDCGTNWVSSALTPGKTPNGADCYAQEGCIVELDDGTWEYMGKFGNGDTDASGDNGRRLFFRSRNFKDWAFDRYHPHDSIRAQGSVLWLGDGVKTRFGSSRYAACFSTWGNYPSERRGRVKLFFGQDTSSDESKPGITWDCGEMMLIPEHTGACSYNSMVMIDDDTLGVLIESHCHIYLIKVDLTEVLTK